jgi:hypothetical protein
MLDLALQAQYLLLEIIQPLKEIIERLKVFFSFVSLWFDNLSFIY